MQTTKFMLSASFVAILSACGGGGGSDPAPATVVAESGSGSSNTSGGGTPVVTNPLNECKSAEPMFANATTTILNCLDFGTYIPAIRPGIYQGRLQGLGLSCTVTLRDDGTLLFTMPRASGTGMVTFTVEPNSTSAKARNAMVRRGPPDNQDLYYSFDDETMFAAWLAYMPNVGMSAPYAAGITDTSESTMRTLYCTDMRRL